MKILLLGKSGLLGQALFAELQKNHEVFTPSHSECNVLNKEEILKTTSQTKLELIINATGYTAVDKAESEPEKAFELNKNAVENLAEAAEKFDIPLLHFSTDYVFDGTKQHGFNEDDPTAPISVYGKSKEAGEKIITSRLKKYFLIRSAWLFGPNGKNFVDTMLALARENKQLRVVNDQFGNPTYTVDLAKAVAKLLESDQQFGIYHLVNEGGCSWYDLAKEIFNQLGVPVEVSAIDSSELARPAKRPKYSMLNNNKFDKLRPWNQALAEYLKEHTLIL